MSIIERAADLLGSVPEPQRKPAANEGHEPPGPDFIERAVNSDGGRFDLPEDKPEAEAKVVVSTEPPRVARTSRILNVDLAKLRRQNMITPDEDRTPISESFRRIKRQILVNAASPRAGKATNLVMITSPLAGEGKTFCTVNLAISIAMEMDRTVLLVDADVARPSVAAALGVELQTQRGLLDVLLDRDIDMADVMCKTSIDKLNILPAGTRHAQATEVLASEAMGALLEEMAARYDDRIILFDSPPLLVASESCVLASRMGQILVVVEAGGTTETALKDALSRVESCNVVGVVLNKGTPPGSGLYGAYGYGYGYGYSKRA